MSKQYKGANPLERFEREGENFIPLRHRVLIRKLNDWLNLDNGSRRNFSRLCEGLTSIFHVEHLTNLLRVEELYSTLDPDDETVVGNDVNPETRERDAEIIFDRLSSVLYAAHYHQLSTAELNEAVRIGFQWGVKLDVDFELFESLIVFARGYRLVQKTRRRWQTMYRQEVIELPEFHRLVIAFRVKSANRRVAHLRPSVIYLKMFKNIPESDLEILLPGTTIKLSLLDRGRILLPSISGMMITLFKIGRGVMLVTLVTMTAVWNWVILVALMVGYILKSVFSYLRTRDKYQLGLTQNLYLKNLDNNLGVIYRVFNEAEEQELCETILVYSILLQERRGLGETQLAQASEAILREFTGLSVRFDVHDALGKLARLDLVEVDAQGLWKSAPIDEAPDRLADYWKKQFDRGNSLLSLNQLFDPLGP